MILVIALLALAMVASALRVLLGPSARDRKWCARYAAGDVLEHSFLRRGWGWDFSVHVRARNGRSLTVSGWGHGLRVDDVLVLPNGGDGARYRVVTLEYERDPSDMWHAELRWYPHPKRLDTELPSARLHRERP